MPEAILKRKFVQVADLMTRKLVVVAPDDSVEVAVQLLRQRGIRHLLVMKKDRLVGIVSDRDVKRTLNPARTKRKLLGIGGLYFLLEPIPIREIMTSDPVTVPPGLSAQEAASIMVLERFGALPVEENGRTVGIITETDLLRYFAKSGEHAESGKSPRQAKRKPKG
jgi:predicted transcriptional regulator